MKEWGWVDDDELARVVVLSPHPDDAVLSCGRFLARNPGATVVTVFCGIPDRYPDPPRRWEVIAGFEPGDDVAALRRDEDRRALAVLDATPVHLDGFPETDFCPDEPPATAVEVVDALAPVVDELDPTLVLCPLGLANPEHVTVHDAALLLRARRPAPGWIAYQDVAYHHIPGLLAWRISRLFHAGLWPTPVAMPIDPSEDRKQRALAEYPSQVRALEADWSLARRFEAGTPEQYWRLAEPPAGWEGLSER
jgi:LmbE family N-acetylglucosaminyl deacetylase